jgi:hypothetical protein
MRPSERVSSTVGSSGGGAASAAWTSPARRSRIEVTHWGEEALVRRRYTVASDAVNRSVAASLNRLYHQTVPLEPEAIVAAIVSEAKARSSTSGDATRESSTAMELRDCARAMRQAVKQLSIFVLREKSRRASLHAVLADGVDLTRITAIESTVAQLLLDSDAVRAPLPERRVCARRPPAAAPRSPLRRRRPPRVHPRAIAPSQLFTAFDELLLTLRGCATALQHAPSDLAEVEFALASELRRSAERTGSDEQGAAIRERARSGGLLVTVVQIRGALSTLLASFQPQQKAVLHAQEAEDCSLVRLIELLPPAAPPAPLGAAGTAAAAAAGAAAGEFIV